MSREQFNYLCGVLGVIIGLLITLVIEAHAQSPAQGCQGFYNGCARVIIDQQEKYNWCLIKSGKSKSVVIPISRGSITQFSNETTCDKHYAACVYSALQWGGAVNGCMDQLKGNRK